MHLTYAPIWKEAPFLRLLVALLPGILLQWYYPLPLEIVYAAMGFCIIGLFFLSFLKGYAAFRFNWLKAVGIALLTALLGMLLTHYKNITHQQQWFGNHYRAGAMVMASIKEAPVEKNRSFKALADVYAVSADGKLTKTTGDIIIYFQKDSSLLHQIAFGKTLLFGKPLQLIENAGNPGAFDYKRYSLFQGITHQVFLSGDDFLVLDQQLQSAFRRWLHASQHMALGILKKYISGKDEVAVAEALLIGYREDLDRDMVQQYSNTGVIHVIAISGMHLAMLFGLLVILLKPLQKITAGRWLRGVIILTVLWSFTLLSGAGPSILRSAVMFSFIIAGESFTRQVSVYHTLAASAFFLLCSNPFFAWDVGFQLSYMAVLSIVIFLRPITNWFYCRNKILYATWQMAAVTISAQILTTPLSIYHFHQLPNLFLFTNLLVVPLSGLILYGEILLCILSGFSMVAQWLGTLLAYLLRFMNNFIVFMNDLPFSVTGNIRINYIQTLLLYAVITGMAIWLLRKHKQMLVYSIFTLLAFSILRAADMLQHYQQPTLVVYNVPQYSAIDFMQRGCYFFAGDPAVENNDFLRNFHLKPARLAYRADRTGNHGISVLSHWHQKNILLINPDFRLPPPGTLAADIIIISGKVDISMREVQQYFGNVRLVFDSSCPAWKTREWKNECDSLHLRPHSVSEDGAFVLKL